MKLFIIGNGFDKGHGLATSYWDFRTYLERLYPDFLHAFEEHYNIYTKTDEFSKQELLWNELETNLANIDEDVIIEQSVSIEMNLDSGDVGIEDTLYEYFSEEYDYIQKLAKYLKQWIRTIRIHDLERKSSMISNDALYLNFNYTAVLETIYKISEERIIHIHGSLRERYGDPILGHGNISRIEKIQEKREKAERFFNEKVISICKVVENYYQCTYKDVNKYMSRLLLLTGKEVDEIIVIGHSLAGVDLPYFRTIDMLTTRKANWKVYYHKDSERAKIKKNLASCGINMSRINMIQSDEFYDLKSDPIC